MPPARSNSVWGQVNRRLTRPVGWLLFAAGSLIFAIYSGYIFATSDANPWEKIGIGGIVIGFLFLLAVTIYERSVEWRTDPYKDVHK